MFGKTQLGARYLWLGSIMVRGPSGCEAIEPVAWLENRRCVITRGRKASCSLTTLGMLMESSAERHVCCSSVGKKGKLKARLLLSSSSSSVRLKVSCEGCRDGWLSCSQTVPVPVLERDIVARLRRYADVEVPTVLMEVLPW